MLLMDWAGQIEQTNLAMYIGESAWFPFLESVHVVGAVMVFGSILMMDLRLLGAAAVRYRVTTLTRDLLPWSWAAFILALITGAGLFITRATHYLENPAFQIKLLLLLLAGINMTAFHFGPFRGVAQWDARPRLPIGARICGAASLLIWIGVLLAGRWVGHLS